MTALNLEPVALDGTQFTTNNVTRVMCADASDVGFRCCVRLYDDACDEGIAIRGRQHVLSFYLVDVVKDGSDEDTLMWVFKPTQEALRKAPYLKDYVVNLFND
jgi:hypothetical protein